MHRCWPWRWLWRLHGSGCVALLLLLQGCATPTMSNAVPGGAEMTEPQQAAYAERQQLVLGYSLLQDVVAQNQNVSLMFLIKRPMAPTKQRVNSIADRCRDMMRWLDAVALPAPQADADPITPHSTLAVLPQVEAAARKHISAETGQALLAAKDARFEVHLLVTQEKSTSYIAALCHTLSEREPDEGRRARLQAYAHEFDQFNQHVLDRLAELAQDAGAGSAAAPNP